MVILSTFVLIKGKKITSSVFFSFNVISGDYDPNMMLHDPQMDSDPQL